MMTGKERVRLAFEHRPTDRVPMWYGAAEGLTDRPMRACGVADEEALMRRLGIDFRRVHGRYVGPDLKGKTFWGIQRGGAYYGQPLSHPLAGATTLEEVAAYSWPSPDWFDFSHVGEQCRAWRDFSVIGGPWAVVFTDTTELVGMEEFFVKMYTHPEVLKAILQRVSDFYAELAVRFFEAAGGELDIFFFGDDMGTQQDLIISPEKWCEFCRPHVERFVRLGHEAGLKVMFHSCGAVRKIIPALVDLRLDALNPVQVQAHGMDLRQLKAEFGDRLTFHGGIDHQKVLARGTAEDVRKEVRRVVDIMAPGGGYCLAASHDLMLEEFPAENVTAMYDEGRLYSASPA